MKPLPLSQIARTGRRPPASATTSMIDAVATDTPRAAAGGRAVRRARASASTATTTSPQAARDGAPRAAGVARARQSPLPQVIVADTQRALGRLRRRRAARAHGRRSSRITGSNGKTSVKTLALAILRARPAATYANPGNRNNEIGLPLAVLDAPEDAQFAIYEMGAGKPGDIAYLDRDRAPARRAGQQHRAGAPGAHGQPARRRRDQGRDLRRAAGRRRRGDQCRRCVRAVLRRTCARPSPDCASASKPAPTSPRATSRRCRAARASRCVTPQGEADDRAAAARPPQRAQRAGRGRARARRRRAAATRSPKASTTAQPVAGRLIAHRLRQRRGADRRQLQRQPGSLAAAIDTLALERRRALAGARRHARTRRRCRSAARRGRPPRARRGHRAAVHARPAQRRRSRAFGDGAPPLRHATTHWRSALRARAARRRARAGQGLARQRDGQDRAGAARRAGRGERPHAA